MPSRFAIRMHMAVIALTRLAAIAWLPITGWMLVRLLYSLAAFSMATTWPTDTRWDIAYHALLLVVNAAFLFVLVRHAPKIADWVVPAARGRCPACGYPRTGATGDKCAECSLSFES